MRKVAIIGVGMHAFGKFPEKNLKGLALPAILNAVEDAKIGLKDIEAAYVGNSYAGLITGQEAIRGQTITRYCGLDGIPVINVENACASASTALREAYIAVAAGVYDVALALGVEKLFCGDTARSIKALATGSDLELTDNTGFQFTGIYAMKAKDYMRKYGATAEDFARVVVKNSTNGSRNPYAQFHKPLTVADVVNSKKICEPLTLYMCSSMADGAAAAIICSLPKARRYTSKPIFISGSSLRSGIYHNPAETEAKSVVAMTAAEVYKQAGIEPSDVDFAEVHDAAAPAEFDHCEDLGFCEKGTAYKWLKEGKFDITGDLPVNPSGGLLGRGHPVGATGLAQTAEIVWQLRGEAGERQIMKDGKLPKAGLALNTGGRVDDDRAAIAVHLYTR